MTGSLSVVSAVVRMSFCSWLASTPTSASLSMLKPLTVWITTNWEILKVMGIPDHLTCLLWNLYAGQEATLRTRHGTMDWFQIGKGVCQGCILSPCLLNLYAECMMWNSGLDEAQAGIKISGRNSNTSDMQMTAGRKWRGTILREISPECSLEGLMLKLKLQ